MDHQPPKFYEFLGFHLDVSQKALTRNGEMILISRKALDLLLYLVQNRGRILEKNELMEALWPDSFVEESNLSHQIFVLRKALGDDQNGNSFIQTIPKRGYKFVAAVRELDTLLEEAKNGSGESTSASDYWSQNSPFRSLRAFEPEDSWLFFGRETEIEDLLRRLNRFPVLTIIGNSGSGKSSLVRAGLIPALQKASTSNTQTSTWRIVLCRPSGAPFDYLAEILPGCLAPELSLQEQSEFITYCREKLPSGGTALRDAIVAIVCASSGRSQGTRVLLVVDQFEEIFTLTASQEIRTRYIDGLLAASSMEGAVPVHLVLILRADFYANCLEHPALSTALETNLYNLPRMSQRQLRESIERRLELTGGHAEPGLIDSLLSDVGTEPSDLALLEHALGLLWERCRDSGHTLTNQAYSKIGRLRGALGRHADQVYDSIVDESHRETVRRIFLELVHLGEGAQEARRRVRKADLLALGDPQQIELLLARLASSRLIAIEAEGQEIFVEVSHEALIREWPALREWITQNRDEIRLERRLMQAAEEWEGLGREPGALLQGTRLAQAQEWLHTHDNATALVREFIEASIAAELETARREQEAQEQELARQQELREQAEAKADAEKQLRQQQETGALQAKRSALRLRWLSCALAVLLLVAIGAAWFAHHQKIRQEALTLAAQAEEVLPRDNGLALDLAIKGWRTAKTEQGRLAVTKTFPTLLATFKHDGPVEQAVFSPDGQLILTAGDDRIARVWSALDGHLLATLLGHADKIVDAEFSPDSRRIVTASDDHTARVWDAQDGQFLFVLDGHSEKVSDANFSPDGRLIITSSDDATSRIWNSTNGQLLLVLRGHESRVRRANFSPDSQRIVTASLDGTARVWSTIDSHLICVLQHSDWVVNAKFSPDGQRIITSSSDHTARIWNGSDGRLLATLQHAGPVSRATFSSDGQRVITVSYDHTAKIWDAANGSLLKTLKHDGAVGWAEFSPDGRYVTTASYNHTASIWAARDGSLLVTFQGYADEVWGARFSPDGQRVLTTSADNTARLWGISGVRLKVNLTGHTDAVRCAQFSPNGQYVVTSSDDATARIWNASNGRLTATLNGHAGRVFRAAFSPDGQRIVTASQDPTAKLWNTRDGHLLATLNGHTDQTWDAAFSFDSQRVVTASLDHTAKIWNTSDGRLLTTLSGHTDHIREAVFSPDGQRVVTASADHTAKIWYAADGQLLATLECGAPVSRVAFSSDGSYIAVSAGAMAQVWDVRSRRLFKELKGHTAEIFDVTFAQDSHFIATASRDQTARIWQIITLEDLERILSE